LEPSGLSLLDEAVEHLLGNTDNLTAKEALILVSPGKFINGQAG
jgi:hypothetical protein